MHNTHVIDPVTRIEGHAKITLQLEDDGTVSDARFHVTEFRGFEELCGGRPFQEMPALTARTCGICPVSHLLASAKAGDAIMSVAIPPAAVLQRRLANLGQIIQSHALSFFHLSAPDLLLGMDADPSERNVFGLMASEPEVVRRGIRLRQFGQEVIEKVSGRKIHGQEIVPGGVAEPLTDDEVIEIGYKTGEAKQTTLDVLAHFESLLVTRFGGEVKNFGNFPSLFLGHVGPGGRWEHYDGALRVVDSQGAIIADDVEAARYKELLAEAGNTDSYLKSPYWRAAVGANGSPWDGIYRVGPLARLNVATHFGTMLADAALQRYRGRTGEIATSSFHYHYARLLEVLASNERIEQMLGDPELTSEFVRAEAGVNRRRGVGASEAPRGTLFHDYEVDGDGLITGVNMVIATGHNNLAMNKTIREIADAYIDGPDVPEGTLNRLEAGIRAYDPCLSCSTHALGQMPFDVQVVRPDGEVVTELRRD